MKEDFKFVFIPCVLLFAVGVLLGGVFAGAYFEAHQPKPKIETKVIERVYHVPEPCHDPNTREGMIAKAKQAVKDLNRCTYVLQVWGYEVSTYDNNPVWCNDQRSFWHFPIELTIKEVK